MIMECGGVEKSADNLNLINLHDQELMYPEHRFWEHVKENESYHDQVKDMENGKQKKTCKPLPILALNEVFIGESISARY